MEGMFYQQSARWSQPTRAAWIEMRISTGKASNCSRRSPLGLRGLKYQDTHLLFLSAKSQPSWAAWIEMDIARRSARRAISRSPFGLRGLKFVKIHFCFRR